MCSIFCEFGLITVLLLNHNLFTSWSTRFISLKLCVGFSIFNSVYILIKFIFLFNKSMDSFTLKRRNSFQNKNNRKATYGFALRSLIFKLWHENLKFNEICLSLSSRKTALEINFLNLKTQSFEYVAFTQQ